MPTEKQKPKKQPASPSLTSDELRTISNLLFTGKWNLSLSESNQAIAPIINKIAKIIDQKKPCVQEKK